MRVAIIGVHFAEYSLSLAEAMARDNDVLLIAETDNLVSELGELPKPTGRLQLVRIHRKRTIPSLVRSAVKIVKALREFRPDVVHAQEFDYDFAALVLPFLRRWPYVLTVHDPERHPGEELSGITRIKKEAIQVGHRRLCDYAIVHGQELVHELTETCPHLENRVVAIPHGVLGHSRTDAEGSAVKRGHLLMLGRLHPYKGVDVFVQAVSRLVRQGQPVVGVIAGRGPTLDDLRPQVGDNPNFEVHEGYLSRGKMIQLVDEADVVVLPYLNGTQSGIGMLAIGRGRSIVASRVGSLPEIVHEGVNGLLVPPGDEAALADTLGELVSDRARNDRLRMGAQRMRAEYEWGRIARRTHEVYALARQRRNSTGKVAVIASP